MLATWSENAENLGLPPCGGSGLKYDDQGE